MEVNYFYRFLIRIDGYVCEPSETVCVVGRVVLSDFSKRMVVSLIRNLRDEIAAIDREVLRLETDAQRNHRKMNQ